jgi:hypothetical protein
MDSIRNKTRLMIHRRIDMLRETNNIEERKEIHDFARGMLYVSLSLGILTTQEGMDMQKYLQLVYNRKVENEAES